MASDVVRLAHAGKRFGTIRALLDVCLSLRAGEWLGLLGPNGAGKTTLLRAVCGQIRLSSGTIELFGAPQSRTDCAQIRRLGIVPQTVALFAPLTARENLQTFGGLYGLHDAALERRVAWALDWTGLADRADQQVRGFSGGMMRRLNIACGVLHAPDVILLDEPTLGVDPQSRQRILEMLHQLHASGAALMHATNQIEDAEQSCERIVILDRGAVVADGRPDELVARARRQTHRIVLTLDRPLAAASVPAGFTPGGSQLSGTLVDVEAGLQDLLTRLRRAGARVLDLHVEAPGLRAVFLELTGRELRD